MGYRREHGAGGDQEGLSEDGAVKLFTDYRLLVLDIDGTVTNSKKEVTPKTREQIIRLQREGVKVVLASGRPPEGVFPIAKVLQLEQFDSYLLTFNGGKIIHLKTGKCIFEKHLPMHIPKRLAGDAKTHGIGMAAYGKGVILAGTVPDSYLKLESEISKMPIEYHENLAADLNQTVNQCILTGEPELLEEVEPVLFGKYFHEAQIFHSEPFYLEVSPKNVDKAYGLKHLLRFLGISREKMVCCGDSYNDIRMLQYAGVGIAMKNAPKSVKVVADYVTENDNDHDGIAEVIGRFF